MDPFEIFEFVIDSAEVGFKKPDPEIFTLGVEQLGGVSPQEVAYVGDSVFHDVAGARQAGYAQSWLVDPLGLNLDHTLRVPSVAELAEALDGRHAPDSGF